MGGNEVKDELQSNKQPKFSFHFDGMSMPQTKRDLRGLIIYVKHLVPPIKQAQEDSSAHTEQ